MSTVISKANPFNSYNVLFEPNNEVSIDVLRHLYPSELKAAYRKKALETHPDRSKTRGEIETDMNKCFIEVALAYETLSSIIKGDKAFILADKKGLQRKSKEKNIRPINRKNLSDHFYKGRLPKRRLLIGQFLYYSGLISWRTLIDAIIWQKRQRPPIGQIALKWGILSSYDIKRILTGRNKERSYKEKFGEYAWRKGYITSFEHMALLGKQRRLQCHIGEYFIEQRIIGAREIERMIKKLWIHNTCTLEPSPPTTPFICSAYL